MKKNKRFIMFVFILTIIKQILISHFPILALGDSGCDDQLMLKIEYGLLNLKWLGDFNSLTLVKGMFFPFFLAGNAFLGISYVNSVNLFYSISCFVFVYSIRKYIKKDWMNYVIFLILLFNPIMYCTDVVGRVYRNSLTPSQVLLIMSSMFLIFQNRKSDKNVIWPSILCGITLGTFYNTREDAIWIIPFILVFILIMVIEHIIINKSKISYRKIVSFILPVIILIVCNLSISLINYKCYGVFTRVDESSTSFSNAIEKIYSVPDNKDIKYVSVSQDKLKRLYKVSPSLKKISPSIEYYSKLYSKVDRNPNDDEVEDGWFWWVLRFSAEREGYFKNAKTADKFFDNVAKEIENAQDKNLIGKQKTMPSALMSPWKKGYTNKLIKTFGNIYKYTNSYEDISASPKLSSGSEKNIGLFEVSTNDKAIFPYSTTINGFYKLDRNYTLSIIYDNKVLKSFNCKSDEECKINYSTSEEVNYQNLVIKINDNDNEFKVINASTNLKSNDEDYNYNELKYESENESYNLQIKSNYETVKNQLKISNFYASKLNIIIFIYQKTGLIFSIFSILVYLFLSYYAIKKDHSLIDEWLIISSIISSYIVLCLGVSYNHISSCDSITTLYLSGAYALILMFNLLCLNFFVNNYKKIFSK